MGRLLKRGIADAQRSRHVVGGRIDAGEVEPAIVVEIAGREHRRAKPHRTLKRSLEAPVPPAQQHGNIVRQDLSGRKIEAAVAVNVGRGQAAPRGRHVADPQRHLLRERPVPTTQQEGNVGGTGVADRQVDATVAVKVALDEKVRTSFRGDARFLLKRPVPIAHKQRYALGAGIGHGQVEYAIPVEVVGDDAQRLIAHGKVCLVLKGAVAVAQENRNVVVRREEIGDGQVQSAIAVEVAGGATGRRIAQPKQQRGRKGSVPPAQVHGNPIGELAAGDQVDVPVAVEIA